MAHPILPIIIAVACGTAPAIDLNAKSKDPVSCMKADPSIILIADRDERIDGPDPHGPDPHDEQHDKKLPANKDRDTYKAPKDPYGDKYPQGRAPY